MTDKPDSKAGDRITVKGPLEILYDPRGPVTVDPAMHETTPEEQEKYRRTQDRAKK